MLRRWTGYRTQRTELPTALLPVLAGLTVVEPMEPKFRLLELVALLIEEDQ